MAVAPPLLTTLSATPTATFLKTSFLPPTSISLPSSPKKPRTSISTTVTSYYSSTAATRRIVRFPALDRRAALCSRLRFATKLKTLLLSKPRHALPLPVLRRCRRYLAPSGPLLRYVRRYPSLFRLSPHPLHPVLEVSLSPDALSLAALESRLRAGMDLSLAAKLHRLLMLAHSRRILLSKLVHIAPDLGLAPDFRSRLCNAHPDCFRTVHTSYGRSLELVSWDPALAVPTPPISPAAAADFIVDRPPKFKHLKLRRGLNLKRRHRDYLIKLQEMPDFSPYSEDCREEEKEETLEKKEKRACAVVREVLGMTTEKRTLVDHLTHFRSDFELPNRLHAMLVRHPEMFYVSPKGVRHSVFLVEAYDDKGTLLVEDEFGAAKRRLVKLVNEGKRMQREWKRGYGYGDDYNNDDDGESGEEKDFVEEEGDALDDLFEGGIGDDWEDIGAGDDLHDYCEKGVEEVDEFWIRKTVEESDQEGRELLEAW